ncbi:Putative complex 1 LYR protein [Septoria linicola]|uniref:LYR motif-containing protein 2 n=1 Tax=Septoria linicola TaxID=215465 RepID=A0A9Q9AIS7_9PEZI|nr:putative complex 1 LYR protein [Septoria linicola]USW48594.1 Putative complex 1 LYR protein [Septoria linicola]
MYASIRRYATISPDKAVRFKGKTLTLEHFLQRQKVMNLWRECIRTINKIPPSMSTRKEMRDYARYEFERYRNIDDLGHIRYLVSTGKTQLDSMSRYVEQNAM